jgi:peptidoglycan/LPS O-acetylase OafA/YrhL
MPKIISKHIPVLDGIRAYAILMVCLVHFFQVDETGLYSNHKYLGVFLYKLSQLGLKGVELFFMLSGFLITGILVDSKKSNKYFRSFYARRFIRIFPLYYFVLAISFLVLPHLIYIDDAGKHVINNQFWLWTYTSNISHFLDFFSGGWDASLNFPSFGHFWSLCVEEHFYIFWPFIIYFVKEKHLKTTMWFIVSFSSLAVIWTYIYPDYWPILNWTTIQCAGVLSLGGLLALEYKNKKNWDQISMLAKKLVLPFVLLFMLSNFIPRRYDILHVVTYFTSIIAFLLVLIVALNNNKITNKCFNRKWLYFIGKISYGIYVYHGMLRPYFKSYLYDNFITKIDNGIIATILYTILATGISILIAWGSWELIEKPILKLKNYFKY